MKRKSKAILVMMLVMSLIFTTTAIGAIIYTETFEDEAVNTDPVATWYTYTETTSFEYANVTNDTFKDGAQSFLINDSVIELNTGYVDFNLTTQYPYESFDFWFRIDTARHGMSSSRLMNDGRTNILCYWNVTNSTIYLNNSDGNKFNFALTNAWMRCKVVFNWVNDTIQGFLYNAANVLLETSAWFKMDATLAPNIDEIEYFNTTAPLGNKTWIAFDGFNFVKDSGTERRGNITDELPWFVNVMIIVMASMIILYLVNKMAGGLDPKQMVIVAATVMVCMAVILGFVGL